MATLPEALKAAVLTQDWDIICKTYTAITGEPLEVPKPKEPDWANMEIEIPLPPSSPMKGFENELANIEVSADLGREEIRELGRKPANKESVIILPESEDAFEEEDEEDEEAIDNLSPEDAASLIAAMPDDEELAGEEPEENSKKKSSSGGKAAVGTTPSLMGAGAGRESS